MSQEKKSVHGRVVDIHDLETLLEMLKEQDKHPLHFTLHVSVKDGEPRVRLFLDQEKKKRVFLQGSCAINGGVSV